MGRSPVSKTANVPTDFRTRGFKDIYRYAYEQGPKGCTTFRFNPRPSVACAGEGGADPENTRTVSRLADGSEVEVGGNEQIEYDGEQHTAANPFDALKEGLLRQV